MERFFLFLTHGGSRIGGGHLSRCLALAGAFEDLGVPCLWAVDPESRALLPEGAAALDLEEDPFALGAEHLRSRLLDVVRWFPFRRSGGSGSRGTSEPSESFGRRLRGIIVDSYAPSPEWLRVLAGTVPLVVIDDDRSRPVERVARILINYNLNAEEIPYGGSGREERRRKAVAAGDASGGADGPAGGKTPPPWGVPAGRKGNDRGDVREARGCGERGRGPEGAPLLLLGPGYALIRPEIARLARSGPPPEADAAWPSLRWGRGREGEFPSFQDGEKGPESRFVLLVSGGADPAGVTEDAVRRWGEDLLPLRAVLGPRVDPERAERLAAAAQDRRNVRILRAPADFPVLLATAEIVVCTSSVTAYEALALRRRLIVFQTAENQAGIGRKIGRMGWGIDLGRWEDGTFEKLRAAVLRPPDVPPPLVNPWGALEAARVILREFRRFGAVFGGG